MMKKFFALTVSLLLAGCISTASLRSSAPPLPVAGAFDSNSTPTAGETVTPSPAYTATTTPTLVPTLTPTATPPSQAIQRVLIVSFDGLRGDAVIPAPMVNVMRLIGMGAYTLQAHSINYPTTMPAHASMLSGLCLDKHGVTWNSLLYYNGYSQGTDIYDLAKAADLRTVMIVGKTKLRQLAEPQTTDVFEYHSIEASIADAVVAQISLGFDLMFVHFPSADLRGHKYGWMSNAQFKALREGDAALGQILNALDAYNLRNTTLLIVTADHGGHDRTHDGTLQADYDIPWILSGPGVLPIALTTQVEIMDTAATAAYALELPIPDEWDGVPVYEAFGLPIGERLEEVCP